VECYILGTVSNASYLIFVLGLVFELALVYRFFRGGTWRRYPYAFAYVVLVVVQTAALYAVFYWARSVYVPWYLNSGIVNLWARFLIVWEVFRHTFPARSSLRRMILGGFAAAVLLAGTLLAAMSWGILNYGKSHSLYRALDRSFGFSQAVLILLVLIVARYYRVQLGRNIWGIAVAFGMYSSLSTANSAFVDVMHSFFPYWQLLSPLSLTVMLGMWTWALWSCAPNPALADDIAVGDVNRWSEDWGRTLSTVRKVMNP
jgi:hypothetical protein